MAEKAEKKMGLGLLVAVGVGSMIGGGVFNSPTDLISVANPIPTLMAWVIGGAGVIFLALIFKLLAETRPDLKGGIYSYARAGFGDFMGFLSTWGYWVSGWFGNVAFFTLIIKTTNSLLGPEHQLKPIVAFLLASAILWFVVWLQTRGAKSVGIINFIVTIAKLLPLALVIILGIFVFDPSIFAVDNWQNTLASAADSSLSATSIGSQIGAAMGVILWCFIGVEASVVLAEKAESAKIVGKATVFSIVITLLIYIGISVIAMGVIPADQLAQAGTPLAEVLGATVIGGAGAVIVKVGILVSLLGALLTWVMIAAQLPYVAAKEGILPKMFAKENSKGVPTGALYITNGIVQVFFLVLLSDKLQNMYNTLLLLATTCILIPYLLSSLYAFKVCREDKLSTGKLIISAIAVIYSIYVIFAVGLVFLGASFILYAIGMFAFIKAKKENNKPITGGEKLGIAIVSIIGIVMIILLATGVISL
ncbi:basic amino acid/polyamine antiporter [Bacillus sp. 1P06AnD]|uniref:basic amino acid/polyamine antiporter n=1 Tax=Bacillus sp. 1P06AnD TaxID=3132208 RepID=UPI0039A2937C